MNRASFNEPEAIPLSNTRSSAVRLHRARGHSRTTIDRGFPHRRERTQRYRHSHWNRGWPL